MTFSFLVPVKNSGKLPTRETGPARGNVAATIAPNSLRSGKKNSDPPPKTKTCRQNSPRCVTLAVSSARYRTEKLRLFKVALPGPARSVRKSAALDRDTCHDAAANRAASLANGEAIAHLAVDSFRAFALSRFVILARQGYRMTGCNWP
jgi:hypothetical protein